MKIERRIQINASAETVYSAFSTEPGMQGWWSKDCKIAGQAGGESVLNFVKPERTVVMTFRTDILEPNNKMLLTCVDNGNPAWIGTTLSFEVVANDDGCAFTMIHDGFDPKWEGQPPYVMTVQGWDPFIASIKSYCETGIGQPI